mmetsp:Transcript_37302/g.67090  ORF Transcript_37302/g.67090 Transcript_37302/m.67090 type:complete len:224 (+) Transcript_37302:118-789(+)|eukprot:CAMPEP_0201867372 /NCGR_PEP_ID=MMETSP0902-20130614/1621_1 /ASSEMBLY_ACC=CAM_ASM_000551 /TAXON_ID=420261 /ORGANISM="Thalassiosira antarctica, Strain CCMP982" /LENGTH=223 /DNA_ID=CAMNT_0048392515 /DNA_START=109 /DNA_END=780 /DNA_ORIENTATION=+
MTRQPNNHLNAAITLALFLGPIIYLTRKQKRLAKERQHYKEEREAERAFLSALVKDKNAQPLRPPLPEIVRRVLSRCRLSYLSTVDVDSNSSHLSMMRFTYLPDEETIVMSTNVKTKKYDMLEKQSGVALLIHDFSKVSSPHTAGEDASAPRLTGEYSITLNGTCSVVKDVVLAEKYRAAHLKNNPDYPQFIVGTDIAMLRVDVAMARICNINDEVVKWNVAA